MKQITLVVECADNVDTLELVKNFSEALFEQDVEAVEWVINNVDGIVPA